MSAPRTNIMLGTAGHVDHGKTAVVKLLTGCDLDTLVEEKQRGMTIDLGFAPCRLAHDRIVGVVDVPGHADFIRNMVAGAHGIDIVIFVVAADDGVMPQTREHLNILTLMGIRHGLVALTKIDLVDGAMRAMAVEDVRRLLAGTFLETAPICPLSTLTGEGFEGFYETLNQVAGACTPRAGTGLFHLWVEDVHAIRGAGTVITGIPTRGTVRVGDLLTVLPAGVAGRVRRLQVYGQDAAEGRAGECVALNLTEAPHESIKRGMVVCAPGDFTPVALFEARFQLLPGMRGDLKDYAEIHLHIGTAAGLARVAMLEQPVMAPGQAQFVQFRLAEPLGLAPGERFVARANAGGTAAGGLATIGGGRVLGVSNLKLRRKRPWTLASLAARAEALDDPSRWCEVVLQQTMPPPTSPALARSCHLTLAEAQALLAPLQAQGRVLATASSGWVHRENVRLLADQIVIQLNAFHASNPKRLGPDAAELRASVRAEPGVFDLACDLLRANHQIEQHGPVLAAPGWKARVSSDEETICAQVGSTLREALWSPPSPTTLAETLRQPEARIQTLLRLLTERGELVRLNPELLMHRDAVEAARAVVLRLFAKSPSFTTMDFRDALGVSRKYAVPLLDHLDANRFTVRDAHHHTPGAEARKRMS